MTSHARAVALERFRWIGGHADVWPIFRDPGALALVVRGLAGPFRDDGVTAVCGVESRGFLLGAAVAVELGVGFVAVRKSEGIFPGDKVTRRSDPDYRGTRQELRLQRAAVDRGDRVLLVDDWIETGSQASAVRSMVEECGGQWAGCSVVVDQTAPARRADLGVRSIVAAAELPAWDEKS
ncbi:adenine phosphoribosyltransferase [Streptomyces sp. LamerLS-316]|uniref:phosphoribosyltransferase family protein n=1 Tax=unclassified Streptomyces TaxID=2593676 RepID=UPI000823DC00|nr:MULTISPECIES: phosphoribosyltransferase family protein [unclassified Streptomyces]MYQ40761.1 phosphoribosyltransferase [Streptomyces sp. SID4921]SCK05264.1 adenine phosphoribosyltransferase [Streptomyces sp. LamerLS-316]